VGVLMEVASGGLKLFQTGFFGSYALALALGVATLLLSVFFGAHAFLIVAGVMALLALAAVLLHFLRALA